MIKIRLKDLMDAKGVTYRQVSVDARVSTSTLAKMNSGRMSMIGVDVIDRLCAYFDCEPGDLIIRVPGEKPGNE